MRAGLLQVMMRAAFDLLRQEAQFGQAALQTPQLHRLMKEMAAESEQVPSPSEIHADLTKRSARALDQSRRLAALADRLIEKGNLSPEEWRQVAECVESALGFTPVAMTAWRIAADAGDEIARHVFEASAIGIASANDDKPVPFWPGAGGYVVPPGPPLAALIREMLAEVVPHDE